MQNIDLGPIIESSLGRINDPIILGLVIIGIVLAYKGPAYIKAIGEVIRLGRLNKVEVQKQQALLKQELQNKLNKRRRHERMKDQ